MKNLFFLLICVSIYAQGNIAEKPIVVVIPSYNNNQFFQNIPRYKLNLDSVFGQAYSNYRVIYIDDCSSDGTAQCVKNYIDQNRHQERFTIIENEKRYGPSRNRYIGVHLCMDDEIVLLLDGDDFLADDTVFARINHAYSNPNVWVTYSQFQTVPDNLLSNAKKVPESVIEHNDYRAFGWHYHSLKTFYAWLFKQVKLQDLLYEGKFYPISSDLAEFLPVIEMSGGKFKFISEVMYYATQYTHNELNVHGKSFQQKISKYILNEKPYKPLDTVKNIKKRSLSKPTIDMLIFSQNKYEDLKKLLLSCNKLCTQSILNIAIFYDPSSFDQSELFRLKAAHINLTFMPRAQQAPIFKNALVRLENSNSEYVLIANESTMLTQELDIAEIVSYMQATCAHAFYLSYDLHILNKHYNQFMHHINLTDSTHNRIFAFQYVSRALEHFRFKPCTALFKKSEIKQLFTQFNPITIENCLAIFSNLRFDVKKIGLIAEHAMAY